MSVGRFYSGAQASFRLNSPGRLPFYVAPMVTHNQWDYQQTGGLLGRDVLSTQVRAARYQNRGAVRGVAALPLARWCSTWGRSST
ncbi:MAG: hypothetical protein WKG07_28605 [Hymenobacter sp.]